MAIPAFTDAFVLAFLESRGITCAHPRFEFCYGSVRLGLSLYRQIRSAPEALPPNQPPARPIQLDAAEGSPEVLQARNEALEAARVEFDRIPQGQWTEELLFEWADTYVAAVKESQAPMPPEPPQEVQPVSPCVIDHAVTTSKTKTYMLRAAWYRAQVKKLKDKGFSEDAIGLSPKTSRKIRRGEWVSLYTLEKLADYLKISWSAIPEVEPRESLEKRQSREFPTLPTPKRAI